jgi:hypothetical protein
MDNLTDTFLNIVVFVFIGVMVWLYLKKDRSNTSDRDQNVRLSKENN